MTSGFLIQTKFWLFKSTWKSTLKKNPLLDKNSELILGITIKLVVVFLVIFIPIQAVAIEENRHLAGIGLFTGTQIPELAGDLAVREYFDWTYIILLPVYGWKLSERWELYLEGNLGWYHFDNKFNGTDDDYTIGLSLMTTYDFLKFSGWAVFAELGLGAVYFTGIPEEQGEALIDRSGVPVLVQAGAGFKFHLWDDDFLKLSYRYTHASSISSAEDGGLNTHGILISIVRYW